MMKTGDGRPNPAGGSTDFASRAGPAGRPETEGRRQTITKRLDALKTVSDLRGALQRQAAWRADEERDETIKAIDQRVRQQVGERFRQALRRAMKDGGPAGQLAAVELLEEIGV